MQSNKRVTLAIMIGVLCVFGIISSSTYSLWRITKTQETPNEIVAACLDLTLEQEQGTFSLSEAWPMTDEEGAKLTGYTFTVENKCQNAVNYIVGLDSLEITDATYLSYDSLKVKIDDKTPMIYGNLNDLDNQTVLASKMISRETVSGKSSNTHTIRVWIDEKAPISEQEKQFEGQVFITGGQGIRTDDSCFTIADNGTILGYDETCGLSVTVPDKINGIDVKEINFMSFSQGEIIKLTGRDLEAKKNVTFLYYKDDKNKEMIENYYKTQNCEDVDNCDLSEYITIINNYDEYLTYNWDNYTIYGTNHYNYDKDNNTLVTVPFNITSLNLGDAKHLELINDRAFYQSKGTLTNVILPQNAVLSYIGEWAFVNNLSLKSIKLSNTLKTIDRYAFMKTYLEKVTIPASVEIIGDYSFSQNNTKVIEFEDTKENPSKLTTIGQYAFQKNSLDKIVFPSSLKLIDDFAFMNSYLNEVYISASVENIGGYSFKDNYTISKLVFEDTDENPSQLKEIEYQAFEYNKLTSVKLPRSLEIIGNSVFARNDIKIGVIPENVINIGGWIFYYNDNIEKIIVKKNSFDGITVNSHWNAATHVGSGVYTYTPYEFNPDYIE